MDLSAFYFLECLKKFPVAYYSIKKDKYCKSHFTESLTEPSMLVLMYGIKYQQPIS